MMVSYDIFGICVQTAAGAQSVLQASLLDSNGSGQDVLLTVTSVCFRNSQPQYTLMK